MPLMVTMLIDINIHKCTGVQAIAIRFIEDCNYSK